MKKLFLILVMLVALNASGQWVQTNGPSGGQVSCINGTGTTLFVGTYNGVFRSTNYGMNWDSKSPD